VTGKHSVIASQSAAGYSLSMKLFSVPVFLSLLLIAGVTSQRTIPPEREPSKILIRLLNGKNGRPINHEGLAIVLGENPQKDFRTDSQGELIVDLSNSHPRDLRAWMFSYYVDCRSNGDTKIAGELRYSLDEIASKGIVAENDCGKTHIIPTPGVLVLYMRPMTFKERWWL
jgi:hypothetical protein